MDPMKLPQTTSINLHSNFVPSPRLRGVSFPVPVNFAPTDNPTTFDQAAVQNKTKIYQSEGRVVKEKETKRKMPATTTAKKITRPTPDIGNPPRRNRRDKYWKSVKDDKREKGKKDTYWIKDKKGKKAA